MYTKKCCICNRTFFPSSKRKATCSDECKQKLYVQSLYGSYRSCNPLTETQKQVVFGSFLGDGYLAKAKQYGHFYLAFEHSTKQTEYVQWKSKLLGSLNGNISKRDRFDKRTGNTYHSIRCRSKIHPEITEVRKSFYRNGKKEVSRKMLNMLTPLGIAIWFMDDGFGVHYRYLNKNWNKWNTLRHGELCLGNVSERESKTVKKYFRVMLGIETKHFCNKRGCYYLRMNGTEFKKFVQIVGQYIIPSMRYKVEVWKDNSIIPSYNITPLETEGEDIVQIK